MHSALKKRQMFARCLLERLAAESCCKTHKHRGSEYFTQDAEIV
jgi:hypothetical protein